MKETSPAPTERTLILAPRRRDAVAAKAILCDASIHCDICRDLTELVQEIEGGADLAVILEEATRSADVRGLAHWVASQPPWSDFPFVLLTEHVDGLECHPAAARLTEALGSVTFLERPFHPTSLINLVRVGLREAMNSFLSLLTNPFLDRPFAEDGITPYAAGQVQTFHTPSYSEGAASAEIRWHRAAALYVVNGVALELLRRPRG